MKKNNLERFVRDNRAALDTYEPSEALWDKIDQKLPQIRQETKVIPLQNKGILARLTVLPFWQIAAGVILVLGLGFGIGRLNNDTEAIAQIDPQVGKTAVYFASLIQTKRAEIDLVKSQDPALYKMFEAEFEKLESNYQSLRSALPESPNQEVMIAAMIDNLQQQIDLLNTQLSIIQRLKTYKKNHETQTNPNAVI
jgi:hypothetical protein